LAASPWLGTSAASADTLGDEPEAAAKHVAAAVPTSSRRVTCIVGSLF
jgi:hypothetical protein